MAVYDSVSIIGRTRVAQEAERLGYGSVWVSDHIVIPNEAFDRFGGGLLRSAGHPGLYLCLYHNRTARFEPAYSVYRKLHLGRQGDRLNRLPGPWPTYCERESPRPRSFYGIPELSGETVDN